jgi:hypothetical protein
LAGTGFRTVTQRGRHRAGVRQGRHGGKRKAAVDHALDGVQAHTAPADETVEEAVKGAADKVRETIKERGR